MSIELMEEPKQKNNFVIPVLAVLVFLLATGVIYLMVRPYLNKPQVPANDVVVEDKTEGANEVVNTVPPSVQQGTDNQYTTPPPAKTDHKDDLDKDLQSLDALDISTPENDLSDDKLSDL